MNDTEAAQDIPKPSVAQRGANKLLKRIAVQVIAPEAPTARKPAWIRAKPPASPEVLRLKSLLREQKLHTVCEEAACPNLGECFSHGTATFMILGDICTRRCSFCNVAFGRPQPPDADEPARLAETIALMKLRYVVITSVDRDDLKDGGAGHFAACIQAVRARAPGITIEVLVPDFRKRMDIAVEILAATPPDVFNHNLETVPRLYPQVRPGAVYSGSLKLLQRFKRTLAHVPTKSGLMLGLGEEIDEIKTVMHSLRTHDCDMLTLGQYLQPSRHHLPVQRYVHPEEFAALADYGRELKFSNVASAPLVRSSYHADLQARGEDLVLP
jgi:lipoic acid synthetase